MFAIAYIYQEGATEIKSGVPVNTKLWPRELSRNIKNRCTDFRAEIFTIFLLLFWKIDDFINSF